MRRRFTIFSRVWIVPYRGYSNGFHNAADRSAQRFVMALMIETDSLDSSAVTPAAASSEGSTMAGLWVLVSSETTSATTSAGDVTISVISTSTERSAFCISDSAERTEA